jgi:hypothetical protein
MRDKDVLQNHCARMIKTIGPVHHKGYGFWKQNVRKRHGRAGVVAAAAATLGTIAGVTGACCSDLSRTFERACIHEHPRVRYEREEDINGQGTESRTIIVHW